MRRALVAWVTVAILIAACEQRARVTEGGAAPGATWQLDAAGPDGPTGWWPSLATDALGTVHLSYCDVGRGDLRYGVRTPEGWILETVLAKGSVGKYTAIAAGNDRVGIAFYDQDRTLLRYAERHAGGAWAFEDVAWGKDIGMGAELSFDAVQHPHIFYYLAQGGLAHAEREQDGTWHKRLLSSANGGYTVRIGVASRPDGYWISHVDTRSRDVDLKLLTPTSAGHTEETLAAGYGAGWRSQILFLANRPLILYSQNRNPKLRLVSGAPDDRQVSTITERVGNFAALADRDGDIAVAYEDLRDSRVGAGRLSLLRGSPTQWRRFEIDPTPATAGYLALAVDGKDQVVIAYTDARRGGLKIYDESRPR